MPPIVLQIVAFISLISKAGPDIAEVYKNAREIFATFFQGKIITAAQQATLMAWAEEHEAKVMAGDIPPALQVEPDPETPPPPTDPA